MLDEGVKGMIGKGKESDEVKESMQKNNAVYFAAIGGAAAAKTAKSVKEIEVIALMI